MTTFRTQLMGGRGQSLETTLVGMSDSSNDSQTNPAARPVDWETVVGGVDFGEGPRWHQDRLWYSDFYQRAVYSVSLNGDRRVELGDLADQPSGLGWLPDGRLIISFMDGQKVMRLEPDGALVVHADLADVAKDKINDMVVAEDGTAYVGNFGFDLDGGEAPEPTTLALVRPDGTVETAASDLLFPNGSVITPDGSTLIVGETFGNRYTAFTINNDGSLTDRRTWAEVPGMFPDGCCLDAEGAIWFADASGKQVVRVVEGGGITDRLPAPQPTFACMLGGEDGRTLFVLCAQGAMAQTVAGFGRGQIIRTQVSAAKAGRP